VVFLAVRPNFWRNWGLIFYARYLWRSRLIVAVLAGGYSLWAGSYLEVPADVWQHFGSIRDYTDRFNNGVVDTNQPWYLFYAYILSLTSEDLFQTVKTFSVVASVIFALGIFEVAREIALVSRYPEQRARHFGLLSALFTFSLFGTSEFAFVRYYVFAPVFFNFLIFLLACHLICAPRSTLTPVERYLVPILCFLVTISVHRQEALFILCVSTVIGGFYVIRTVSKRISRLRSNSNTFAETRPWSLLCLIWAAVTVTWTLVGDFFSKNNLTLDTPLANNTIQLSFLSDRVWFIADPLGRCFETIGIFGLLAAIAYALIQEKNRSMHAITCLALTPALFLFNPIFLEPFIWKTGHDVVWRFTYIFPVGFVAGAVFERLWNEENKGLKNILISSVLLVAMLPVPGLERIQNLRWNTLQPVQEGNSSSFWQDLIQELDKKSPRNVLTDPITGYVLEGATRHNIFGFKFHGTPPFIPINYSGYGPESFMGYKSWLFVENLRDGNWSEVGERSGHWPGDVMYVSQRYSPQLREFLKKPPDHFRSIWKAGSIRLFEISGQSETME
jgi:hypothetical protein